MNHYQEFPPHPALAAHVACLWTSHAVPINAPVRHRILPDNCIDILWQDRAPCGFVAGMMARAHRVEMVQPTLTLAVRFLPGAARAFFDAPLHELQDEHAALDALWPRADVEALATALWERERPVRHRLKILEDALLAHLLAHLRLTPPAPAEHLVLAAVRLIDGAGGSIRIEDLSRTLGISRQHLALQFRERVGLNAKTYAMVCRFRRAGAMLRHQAARQVDWAQLALDCGYYDQSHLIHEFRLFADETPLHFVQAGTEGGSAHGDE